MTAFGAGSVELDIPEIDAADAPVVFNLGGKIEYGYYKEVKAVSRGSGNIEIRHHDGKFWAGCEDKEKFVREVLDPQTINSTPLAVTEIIRFDVNKWSDRNQRMGLVQTTTLDKIRQANQKWVSGNLVSLRDEESKDDKGEELASRLREKSKGLCFIDGKLFVECVEPILVLNKNRDNIEIKFTEALSFSRSYGDPGFTCSLKDASGFFSFCRDIKEGQGPQPKFEVLDAAACHYDGATQDVFNHSMKLLQSLKSAINGLPREAIDIIFALKDALYVKPGNSEVVTPKLIDTLQRVVDLEPASPLDTGSDMLKYQLLKNKDDDYFRRNSLNNFHLAADAYEFDEFKLYAFKILKRWERASGFERIVAQTSTAMFQVEDELTAREFNTHSQFEKLAQQTGVDLEELLMRISRGDRLVEVIKGESVPVVACVSEGHVVSILGTKSGRPEPDVEKVVLKVINDHSMSQSDRALSIMEFGM